MNSLTKNQMDDYDPADDHNIDEWIIAHKKYSQKHTTVNTETYSKLKRAWNKCIENIKKFNTKF